MMNPNNQQTTGEHLLLIRGTHWNGSLSPAELQRVMTDFYGWVEGLQQKGILRGAQMVLALGCFEEIDGREQVPGRRRGCGHPGIASDASGEIAGILERDSAEQVER